MRTIIPVRTCQRLASIRMDLQAQDAIIFDFDGVLVESISVKTRAFGALYADHGKEVVEQVENYHLCQAGISRFDKFRYFQTEILGGPPLDDKQVAGLADKFSELVVDQVVSAPMVSGAQAFLDSYRGRLPMFVVSGTPTSELGEILERRNLRDYFVDYWGSPAGKKENIADLLRQQELDAGRCLMIGDAIADYEGAVNNAVNFLGRVPQDCENTFPQGVTTFIDFCHFPMSWQ
jgi:phosphoglycolate phosphatase-like HAD superfamily hydrolase